VVGAAGTSGNVAATSVREGDVTMGMGGGAGAGGGSAPSGASN
jgi:hypothetical protein